MLPVLGALALAAAACGVPSYRFDSTDGGGDASGGPDVAQDTAGASDAGGDVTGMFGGDAAGGVEAGAETGVEAGEADADAAACTTCTQVAPSGWTGPLALYTGSSSVPSCSGAYGMSVYQGQGGLTQPPASCSSCSCAITGASCAWTLSGNKDCAASTTCPTFPLDPGGACSGLGLNPAFASCRALPAGYTPELSNDSPGTCAIEGGTQTGATPTFTTTATACTAQLSAAGCGAGETCAPALPAGALLCVEADGAVSCPGASIYSVEHTFYNGINDGRMCSPCQCPVPVCDGTISFYAMACGPFATYGQGTPQAVYAASQPGCYTPPEPMYPPDNATFTQAGVTCTGGSPSGNVTGTGATTFCCTQ